MGETLPVAKQLCFAVYSASHAFTRAYRSLLEPLGLTYPQYLVMLVLWEHDGMRVKEIGAELFLDSGTLTPLLKRLENLGLVRRLRDAGDERQVSIFLTPTGLALQANASSLSADLMCMMKIDDHDASELIRRLDGLRDRLHASAGNTSAAGDKTLAPV